MTYDIDHEYDIAIIGLSGRFPGANNIETFWNNLHSGVESITEFSDKELKESGVSPEILAHPRYVRKAPVLENASCFDAAFFGYTPAEAVLIDPQQRLLLEAGWDALESAGYDVGSIAEPVAVFASTAMNTYLLSSGLSETFNNNYLGVLLGSDKDFQATRLAFKLGLKGPAVTVQTACSSSLVAIHMACQSLFNKECEMALVGAAAVRTPLATGHLAEAGSVFSPDGHCRPFDANANGTIFGSGAAMAVLKSCNKAIEDGDNILAVIKGTAINNDGDSKTDFTAPSITMQAEVISEALGVAGLEPSDISYVEAHGTGTYIGDPIEIEALSLAWGETDASANGQIPIGSVKSNIGHLDAAAGMASLIKVVLALQHKEIPPTINFTDPNPQIDFKHSPFRVAHTLEAWQRPATQLRTAGITSLGMGGTNAHIVVQEFADKEFAAARVNDQASTDRQLIPLSANNAESLEAYLTKVENHLKHLLENKEGAPSLENIAATLQYRRAARDKRAIVLADSLESAYDALRSRDKNRVIVSRSKPQKRDITLLFPGQGAQHVGMGAELYTQEAVYRESIDKSSALFSELLDVDIRKLMFDAANENIDINDTVNAQPCLFATHLAYAALFKSWGIAPKTVVGHSIGQFAAGVIAGIFSHADGARLVAARGKFMQAAPRGVMLSVALPVQELSDQLVESLELAVSNSQDSTVVGGPANAIREFAKKLDGLAIKNTELRTSHAFHTSLMTTAANEFTQAFNDIELNAPTLGILSDTTGQWMTDSQATSPAYWSDHIIKTVNFHECLTTLLDDAPSILLEAGPNATLGTIASVHGSKAPKHTIISAASKRGRQTAQNEPDTHEQALLALGSLWLAGLDVAGAYHQAESATRIALPTAPFMGKSHWYKARETQPSNRPTTQSAEIVREPDKGRWVWSEAWLPLAPMTVSGNPEALLLNDVSTGLISRFALDTTHIPVSQFDIEIIVSTMQQRDINTLTYVVDNRTTPLRHFENLIELCKALTRFDGERNVTLNLVSVGLFEGNHSDAAIALGFVEVLPLEMPHVTCRLIDVPSQLVDTNPDSQLSAVLLSSSEDTVFKINDNTVSCRRLQRLMLDTPESSASAIYQRASHVITGAFGGVGRELAKHIARQGGNLVLLTRSAAASSGHDEKVRLEHEFITQLQDKHGIKVTRTAVDLDSAESISTVLADINKQTPVSLVFHLAGHVEDSLITNKSSDSVARVLMPKVSGTRKLHEAMSVIENARLIVFSSIASWIPAAGQLDYAAANAFQNQYAIAGYSGNHPVTAVAWPGWKSTGMLSRISDERLREAAEQKSISIDDALDLLDVIITTSASNNLGSYLVSPYSLEDEYRLHRRQIRSVIQNKNGTGAEQEEEGSAHMQTVDVVIDIWQELIGVDQVETHENFFDIGGNSLSAVRMCTQLENRLGVSFSPDNLINQNTPESIAAFLESAHPTLKNPPASEVPVSSDLPATGAPAKEQAPLQKMVSRNLVLLNAGDSSQTPVILIHSHGGMLLLYQSLAAKIGQKRPVYGLRASGLDGDVPPETSIPEMAVAYADAIESELGDKPVAIGGYCMGGTIAWETARQLHDRKRPDSFVFMIQSFHRDLDYPTVQTQGTYYPSSAPWSRRLSLGTDKLRYLLDRYRREHSGLVPTIKQLIHGAGNRLRRSFESDTATELAKAGGSENLLAVHRANTDAFWQYEPPAMDLPVLTFTTAVQPAHIHGDKLLGWSDVVTNTVAAVELKGSYLNSFESFNAEHISEEIEQAINLISKTVAPEVD